MNIGILTYHKANNYGAVLQAVAIRIVLQQLGHHVSYLDYYPAYHRRIYRLFSWQHFKEIGYHEKKKYIKRIVRTYKPHMRRKASFDAFRCQHVIPFCQPVCSHFDAIVYGSDQIWRKQIALKDYNPIYFGAGRTNADIHLSYAASMDVLPRNESDARTFSTLISHLNHIAVREQELLRFVQKECGHDACLVLDPVLLLSAHEWDRVVDLTSVKVPKEPYLLYYHLYRGKSNSFDRHAVDDFAARYNLKVVEILGFPQNTDEIYRFSCCGPDTMMALIKHASMVITSSYHGCLFSILYHKPFFVALPKGADRMNSVLDLLGLQSCCVELGTQLLPNMPTVDFDVIESNLGQLRAESLRYLTAALCK